MMRKPLKGEKPSGLAEQALKKAGVAAWKLEPDDVELLRRGITEALDKRAKEWADAWPNQPADFKR